MISLTLWERERIAPRSKQSSAKREAAGGCRGVAVTDLNIALTT